MKTDTMTLSELIIALTKLLTKLPSDQETNILSIEMPGGEPNRLKLLSNEELTLQSKLDKIELTMFEE
jgi:hypothetical protein